jgi:hypothetical protein
MKFNTLMIIKAVVCLGFAPLLLFFPSQLLGLYGTAFSSAAALTARLYGASLVGNLLLTWFARNEKESASRKAITLDLCAYDAVALLVSLILQLSSVMNLLGWSIVAIYLFFTIGFGYFLLPQKKVA